MRLRDRFRAASAAQTPTAMIFAPQALAPVAELGAELLADLAACLATGEDTGQVVRGTGAAVTTNVAGAEHHQSAITWAAARHRATGAEIAPALVLREPTRAHDPHAVRVLVHGVCVGHLFHEEALSWGPLLLECERRGVHLVGVATLREPNFEGRRTVTIALRPSLAGFVSSLAADLAVDLAETTKARRARKEAHARAEAARAAAARPLSPSERTHVLATLHALSDGDPAPTQARTEAALALWATILPALITHVDALVTAAPGPDSVEPLVTALEDAESAADDLPDATEAERPGQHQEWAGHLADLAVALSEQRP